MTNMAGLESDSVYSTGPSIFDLCYTQFDNLAHCLSFFSFFQVLLVDNSGMCGIQTLHK